MSMRVSLPANPAPEGFSCVRIYYPNDPGFLRAIISLYSYLGNWFAWERDENQTGRIAAASFRNAMVLTDNDLLAGIRCCDSDNPGNGDNEPATTIFQIISGGTADAEECEDVAVQKIEFDCETGELVVFYGGCCEERIDITCIAPLYDTPEPGDTQPPTGDTDTACKKAYHVADVFQQFVGDAWDNYLPSTIGLYQWMNNMKESWNRFDLSYLALYRLYVAVAGVKALDTALWSSIWSNFTTQELACRMLPNMNGDSYDWSASEYSAFKSAVGQLDDIVARIVLNTAVDTMTFKNWQKVALESQDITVYSCDCPGTQPSGESEPTSSGWYLGAPIGPTSFPVPQPTTYPDYGFAWFRVQVPHDVYGLSILLEENTGDMQKWKRTNSPAPSFMEPYDVFMSSTNSDNFVIPTNSGYGIMYLSQFNELNAIGELSGWGRTDPLAGNGSLVVANPTANAGDWVVFSATVYDNTEGSVNATLRFLHNINSPSHA